MPECGYIKALYANVTQRSEYARMCLGRVLIVCSKHARILNMTGF